MATRSALEWVHEAQQFSLLGQYEGVGHADFGLSSVYDGVGADDVPVSYNLAAPGAVREIKTALRTIAKRGADAWWFEKWKKPIETVWEKLTDDDAWDLAAQIEWQAFEARFKKQYDATYSIPWSLIPDPSGAVTVFPTPTGLGALNAVYFDATGGGTSGHGLPMFNNWWSTWSPGRSPDGLKGLGFNPTTNVEPAPIVNSNASPAAAADADAARAAYFGSLGYIDAAQNDESQIARAVNDVLAAHANWIGAVGTANGTVPEEKKRAEILDDLAKKCAAVGGRFDRATGMCTGGGTQVLLAAGAAAVLAWWYFEGRKKGGRS